MLSYPNDRNPYPNAIAGTAGPPGRRGVRRRGRALVKLAQAGQDRLLDMHSQSGHGFRDREDVFIPPQRVNAARGSLKLLIQSLTHIDWHAKARPAAFSRDLRHHHAFAEERDRRMQVRGLQLSACGRSEGFEEEHFLLGDVSFVSMNWDPIGL